MATKINIKSLPAGYQSVISNGRHAIVGDEPITGKGTDLGFSPEDLVLAALGSCKVNTVRFIARKNGWEIGAVDIRMEMNVKRNPDRTLEPHVSVALQIEGDLTDEQRTELLTQADNCYVHRMIKSDWNIGNAVPFEAETNGTV